MISCELVEEYRTYPLTIFILSWVHERLRQRIEIVQKFNQNKGIPQVIWKLWTSVFQILTFRDLPFWCHCFDFSLLLQMNQNDIICLVSKLPSLSCCFADRCQHSPVLSVGMCGWFLSSFMEWDYHILCFRKWLYSINHILFMLLFCLCYFILLLVCCDFLEKNRCCTSHIFVISEFFLSIP